MHPWRMIGGWLAVAVAIFGLQASFGGQTSDDFRLPGTEAQRGVDLLTDRFPSEGGVSGLVVFSDPAGDITDRLARSAIEATLAALAEGPHVLGVSDPFEPTSAAVSEDRSTAFASVHYDIAPPGAEEGAAAEAAVRIARDAGLQAELSREVVRGTEEEGGSEALGLVVAAIVLLIAFGSVIAAGIPIGSAAFGIFVGLGLVTLMAGITDVASVSPLIATMIGIGVGIDYALFIVTRHREFLRDGTTPVEAAALANATSGTAVVFAGLTVVVALLGLLLAGIPSITTMGYASAIAVAVAMIGAVTLLPAFLGLAGDRIDRWTVGHRADTGDAGDAGDAAYQTMAGRWADHIGRHPWRSATASLVGLLVIAAPVLDMRTGIADDGSADTKTTYRQAYDLLAAGFGPGFNAPLTIAIDAGPGGTFRGTDLATIRTAVADTPGVDFATEPTVSPSGDAAVITAFPDSAPSAIETEVVIDTLRNVVLPGATASAGLDTYVTGNTPAFIDISDKLGGRLPLFIAAVIAVSCLLLIIVFRSIVVPLKAAIVNLLSIGAAYGVVVAVFQWGWGSSLIGVNTTVPISPFLPMMMFAILFGLSMDYEVFLLSRIREEFVHTGDNHHSVVVGLAATARVITSAALIMISVFAAFLLTPDVEVKMFAVGLSAAVLVDATIVRMVLVPSSMALMGNANWWLPTWLDRRIPRINLEGVAPLPERERTERDDPSSVVKEMIHS
jgi:RND superfamily putative drug exporter